MGERLTPEQLGQEIVTTEKVVSDMNVIANSFIGRPLDTVLSALSAPAREAVETALESARLQGRVEAYKHALNADEKPTIIGELEQHLRDGDIGVNDRPVIRVGGPRWIKPIS